MKPSRRNITNAVSKEEKRNGGKPKLSKYAQKQGIPPKEKPLRHNREA